MLYLTFDKPVDDKVLFDLMTENNLIKIATTPIDNEFENQQEKHIQQEVEVIL